MQIGRFTRTDPKVRRKATTRVQQWNRYSYSIGNPLKFIDPDGRDIFLVVRDDSGGGLTNFGHVALRVVNNNYDVTYDFGRYGRAWGPLRGRGEGVLRVWSNWKAFVAGQSSGGQLKYIRYKTGQKEDSAAIEFFGQKTNGKIPTKTNSNFEQYVLDDNYDLRTNNCTTICLDALEHVENSTGITIPYFKTFGAAYDPKEILEFVEHMEEEWTERSDPFKNFVNKH